MKHFTKCVEGLRFLNDIILGGSKNVVRILKKAGHMSQGSVAHVREGHASMVQVYCLFRSALKKEKSDLEMCLLIVTFLDALEKSYHEVYRITCKSVWLDYTKTIIFSFFIK